MKTDNKQIDALTRSLMKGTTEKPPANLMARIMKQVEKERRATKNNVVSSRPTMAWLAAGLLAYLVLVAVMSYFLLSGQEEAEGVASSLQSLLPVIVVVSVGASIFFCCSQLDNWLRWKRINEE